MAIQMPAGVCRVAWVNRVRLLWPTERCDQPLSRHDRNQLEAAREEWVSYAERTYPYWKPKGLTPSQEQHAVALRANGQTLAQIGEVLEEPKHAVAKALIKPDLQEQLRELRENVRMYALQRTIQIQQAAWDLADKTLVDKDTKGFDSVTRGLSQIERIAASAAGEHSRPQVQVAVVNAQQAPEEAKALIRALLEESAGAVHPVRPADR
jgi:hypothetical protein